MAGPGDELQQLLRAVKEAPENHTAWRRLGEQYRDGGLTMEAAVIFARCTEFRSSVEET